MVYNSQSPNTIRLLLFIKLHENNYTLDCTQNMKIETGFKQQHLVFDIMLSNHLRKTGVKPTYVKHSDVARVSRNSEAKLNQLTSW